MDLIDYSRDDLNKDILLRAFAGTSYSPHQRKDSQIDSYMSLMRSVEDEFLPWVTDENRLQMKNDLERWRSRYVVLLHDWAVSRSQIVSQFVAGGSGWSKRRVRANRRRNDAADTKMAKLLKHEGAGLYNIKKRYDPSLLAAAPIRTEDSDAHERLVQKIVQAEKRQTLMKAANKIARSKKMTEDEKVKSLVDFGLSIHQAREIVSPNFFGQAAFESFELTNNNASIRRMKKRLEEIQALKATPSTEEEIGDCTITDNTDANRVQIFFPDKPKKELREKLSRNGFR